MPEHRVEDRQQLEHTGGQGDLLRLARGEEPLVERPDDGVVAGGDERAHIQRRAQPRPPAPDTVLAPQLARVAVEGRNARERGDLLGVEGAELGRRGGSRCGCGDGGRPA